VNSLDNAPYASLKMTYIKEISNQNCFLNLINKVNITSEHSETFHLNKMADNDHEEVIDV
jgi:hypothetical protein